MGSTLPPVVSRAHRIGVFAFGVLAYSIFFVVIRYFVCFLEDEWIPQRIDEGPARALGPSLAFDLGWLVLFGVQHSVMARASFKRWLGRYLAPAAERSLYLLVTTLLLALLVWQWRPLPSVVWRIDEHRRWARIACIAGSYLGWGLATAATWWRGHDELFGLRQSYRTLRRRAQAPVPLVTGGPYRLARHPMYLGFLVAAWVAPTMTVGHLVLAAGLTLYTLIGIQFEERDLARRYGAPYLAWRERVPMLLPLPRPSGALPAANSSS